MLLCSLVFNVLCLEVFAMRKSSKFFAIRNGRRTGVFYSPWEEIQPLVHGYPKAIFKSFRTENEAIAFLNLDESARHTSTLPLIGRKRKSEAGPSSTGSLISSLPSQTSSTLALHPIARQKSFAGKKPTSAAEDRASVTVHPDTLLIYTDGCCIGNHNVQEVVQPAGWGFVVVSGGDGIGDEDATSLDERFGPIVLEASSPEYLGARVTSNNTAELSAIGQALKYVLDKYASSEFPHVVIRYDSEYAAKSVLGIWNGNRNSLHSHEVR